MGKVYVLERGWPYEGRNVVGVYSDIEVARKEAQAFWEANPPDYSDYLVVTEIDLDAPADWPLRGWKANSVKEDATLEWVYE